MAVGPWPMVMGVMLAASAGAAPGWRRRVRLVTLGTLIALVLYSGYLGDVLRLAGALVGLALGPLLRRVPRPHTTRSSRRETRSLLAAVLLGSALGPLVVALHHHGTGPLAVVRYLFVSPQSDPSDLAEICGSPVDLAGCTRLTQELRFHGVGPTVLSLLPVLLVLLLAYGVARGRRFAWWSALTLHLVLAGLGVVLFLQQQSGTPVQLHAVVGAHSTPGRLIPVAVPLVVVAALWAGRRSFAITAAPGVVRGYLRRLAIATTALFTAYVGLGLLIAGQFAPAPGLVALVADFPRRLAPPGYLGMVELDFVPTTTLATVLFEWTGVALWTVAFVGAVHVLHSERTVAVPEDRRAAREILRVDGTGALSYLTMWRPNLYWFSPDRRSYIAYRVLGGIAVTVGDPVGPATRTALTMAGFAQFCADRHWVPCFYSVTERSRALGAEWGWASVQVAEETRLRLGAVTFSGKPLQDVRTARSRAGREGIRAEWVRYPTAPEDIRNQIAAISREWVATKGLPEMGFTLGGLAEIDDPEVRCLLALDATGAVQAVTSWLPVHQDGAVIGWTLDYMRRRTGCVNGVMEFLISSAALDFQAEGAAFLSLSGAPLAGSAVQTEATVLQRTLDRVSAALEPVYGFRSLLAFKAKFRPEYAPLFLVYPETAALPRIARAIGQAYLPHLSASDLIRMAHRLRGFRATAVSAGSTPPAVASTSSG